MCLLCTHKEENSLKILKNVHVWSTVYLFVKSQHKQIQDAEDAEGQILVLFVHVFIMKAKNTDEIEENIFSR